MASLMKVALCYRFAAQCLSSACLLQPVERRQRARLHLPASPAGHGCKGPTGFRSWNARDVRLLPWGRSHWRADEWHGRVADRGTVYGVAMYRQASGPNPEFSVSGCNGEPSAWATTKVSSDSRTPTFRTSSACLSRCARKLLNKMAGHRYRSSLAVLWRLVA